jgi:hypothetical protein
VSCNETWCTIDIIENFVVMMCHTVEINERVIDASRLNWRETDRSVFRSCD